jgi:hypothetical protein
MVYGNERHRDRDGELSRKHGNTLVGTLRGIYGIGFAPGFMARAELSDILKTLDEPSLSHLVKDHEAGVLEKKIHDAP